MAVFYKNTELVPGIMNGTGMELFFSYISQETDPSQGQYTKWSYQPSVDFDWSWICALIILLHNNSNKTSAFTNCNLSCFINRTVSDFSMKSISSSSTWQEFVPGK